MNDKIFRNNLIELLKGGQAHLSLENAVKGINLSDANIRPSGMQHSVWEVLEHITIAQQDILQYTLDSTWQSPAFPQGYWPPTTSKKETITQAISQKDWLDSLSRFLADLDQVIRLTQNASLDLTSEIPHGEGRTYLRQILLVADHNSYHTAEIVHIRKVLGKW
ncbi:MAG: hypothetical protein FD167_311 [bacterium]|nr:MAG: hypothetical protein FD167_311 [bacterium]